MDQNMEDSPSKKYYQGEGGDINGNSQYDNQQ